MPFSSDASECQVSSSLIRRLVALRDDDDEDADAPDIWLRIAPR